ncbi:hypothetical protein KIPB_002345, partial [Kipferlia bialata]
YLLTLSSLRRRPSTFPYTKHSGRFVLSEHMHVYVRRLIRLWQLGVLLHLGDIAQILTLDFWLVFVGFGLDSQGKIWYLGIDALNTLVHLPILLYLARRIGMPRGRRVQRGKEDRHPPRVWLVRYLPLALPSLLFELGMSYWLARDPEVTPYKVSYRHWFSFGLGGALGAYKHFHNTAVATRLAESNAVENVPETREPATEGGPCMDNHTNSDAVSPPESPGDVSHVDAPNPTPHSVSVPMCVWQVLLSVVFVLVMGVLIPLVGYAEASGHNDDVAIPYLVQLLGACQLASVLYACAFHLLIHTRCIQPLRHSIGVSPFVSKVARVSFPLYLTHWILPLSLAPDGEEHLYSWRPLLDAALLLGCLSLEVRFGTYWGDLLGKTLYHHFRFKVTLPVYEPPCTLETDTDTPCTLEAGHVLEGVVE